MLDVFLIHFQLVFWWIYLLASIGHYRLLENLVYLEVITIQNVLIGIINQMNLLQRNSDSSKF